MNTFGLIFILSGFLLGRQVVVGRVKETPEDLRDMTLGLLSGDFSSLQTTLARRGENVSPDVSGTVAAGASGGTALNSLLSNPLSNGLLGEVINLGSRAKGYRLGATGPDYYDCSGLVWQAMRNLDLFHGSRFTTSTFVASTNSIVRKVSKPAVGDIVLWPRHHMGVMAGPDKVYSAMNPENGIGYATLAQLDKSVGEGHEFYRLADQVSNSPQGPVNKLTQPTTKSDPNSKWLIPWQG